MLTGAYKRGFAAGYTAGENSALAHEYGYHITEEEWEKSWNTEELKSEMDRLIRLDNGTTFYDAAKAAKAVVEK